MIMHVARASGYYFFFGWGGGMNFGLARATNLLTATRVEKALSTVDNELPRDKKDYHYIWDTGSTDT